MVQENQVGMKLNETYKLLVYADVANVLGDNINTIQKNKQTLINASKEVGLEVNTKKTEVCVAVSSPEWAENSLCKDS
jgi:hypothetical protein